MEDSLAIQNKKTCKIDQYTSYGTNNTERKRKGLCNFGTDGVT